MQRLKITLPIIVEGRYDKSTLSSFLDATIITTGGFAVFNNKEKQALLRRIAANGIIVLTDSDGGGRQIRSFLNGILPSDKIHNLYIPKIEGKESRKDKRSREGVLGVEGMSKEILTKILLPFSTDAPPKCAKMITKVDFFGDKLTGYENSSSRRRALCALADLPCDMTPNALLEAMNLLYGYDGYKEKVKKIFETNKEENKNGNE